MCAIGIAIEAPEAPPLSGVFSRLVVGVVDKARKSWGHLLADGADIAAASIPFELSNFRFQGVYFLLKGERIVYVGQTTNIVSRLLGHAKHFGPEAFDRIAFIPIDDLRLLSAVEAFYIAKFTPPLNRTKPWSVQRLERELMSVLGRTAAAVMLARDLGAIATREAPQLGHDRRSDRDARAAQLPTTEETDA